MQECKFSLDTVGLSDHVSQQERTVRYIKFRVVSYYGEGGGLGHLSFNGPLRKQGR